MTYAEILALIDEYITTAGGPKSITAEEVNEIMKALAYTSQGINEITKDPTGFRYNVTSTYNQAQRTITLTGNVEAYYQGIRIEELVDGWTSEPHPEAVGKYFLYYNGTAFVWTTAPWTFDMAMIAIGNSAKGLGLREHHGLIPHLVHELVHERFGTYKKSGGTLSNFSTGSTSSVARRPYIAETVIVDEDIPTTLATQQGEYCIGYLDIAGEIQFLTSQTEIVELTGNQPLYNQNDQGDWLRTPMTNNHYAATYLIALPVTADAASQAKRFVWLMAQSTSATLTDVQALSPASISLGDLASSAPEFVFLAKIIYRYQGGNWTLTQVDYLTGNLQNQLAAAPIPQHNALPGLNVGDYQHLTAAQFAGATAYTTVGTGGEYATFAAAVAAGKTNLLFISNVTETQSSNITVATYVMGAQKNYVWALGNNRITASSGSLFVENITITEAQSGGLAPFPATGFYNVTGTSTGASNRDVCSYGYLKNSTWTFPNATVRFVECEIVNVIAIGGGASCASVFYNITNDRAQDNIRFQGTFSTSESARLFAPTNVYFSGAGKLRLAGGILTGFYGPSANITLSGDAQIINVQCAGIGATSLTSLRLSNVIISGATVLSAVGAFPDLYASNCAFSSTFGAGTTNRLAMNNCRFGGDVTVPATGIDNKFIGCHFAANLTITAGATGTKIYCKTVVGTYTDNGTGTIDL